ncbi:CxxxxCH/CxxCH domain-containing protein [candidate division KSB1 bacterium]
MFKKNTGRIILYVFVGLLAFHYCSESKSPSIIEEEGLVVHENGFMDVSSIDFHGTYLKNSDWNFGLCKSCHGDDYTGGGVNKSCYECHDEGPLSCTTCHGGEDNNSGAPPKDLNHNNGIESLSVGMHTVHVEGTANSNPVSCAACHTVPFTYEAEGHIDDTENTEVIFSGLAAANSSSPSWNRTLARCSSTYCHGNFTSGNSDYQPNWISPQTESCGTCHDLPPSGKTGNKFEHFSNHSDCSTCHSNAVDANLQFIDKSIHINGVLNVPSLSCTACHGGGDNTTGAPPNDLRGNTSTSNISVGMHTLHLTGTSSSVPISCNTCHIIPTGLYSANHLDDTDNAEVVFSGTALLKDSQPSWIRDSKTCSSTYCHGNFAGGNSDYQPDWTSPNTESCGSCHDLPPSDLTESGFQHLPNHINCNNCHIGVVDGNHNFTGKEKHIDGSLEVPTDCTGCHGGTDNSSGAPPNDLSGNNSQDIITVGAHTVHLEGGQYSNGFDCSVCHVVPGNVYSTSHLDASAHAEVVFSGISVEANSNPVWDRASANCSAVYCHGSFTTGNKNNTPKWSAPEEQSCGSCHDIPPSGLTDNGFVHDQSQSCNICHSSIVDENNKIISKKKHINGSVDF